MFLIFGPWPSPPPHSSLKPHHKLYLPLFWRALVGSSFSWVLERASPPEGKGGRVTAREELGSEGSFNSCLQLKQGVSKPSQTLGSPDLPQRPRAFWEVWEGSCRLLQALSASESTVSPLSPHQVWDEELETVRVLGG